MMSALQENLRASQCQSFLDLGIDFLIGNDVSIIRFFTAPERAELAIHIADIGVIDIAIDAEGDDLVATSFKGLGLGQFTSPMG